MKHSAKRRGMHGEGWVIAVALALVLALCFAVELWRLPKKSSVQPVHALDLQALARTEMVNLNLADATQLASLPGIGSTLAERIVEYRAANGDFASIEGIMNVPGVGEGKFAAMEKWIYVE